MFRHPNFPIIDPGVPIEIDEMQAMFARSVRRASSSASGDQCVGDL
jgi:hypothetical protein